MNTNPVVDLLSSRSLAQSASQYPVENNRIRGEIAHSKTRDHTSM